MKNMFLLLAVLAVVGCSCKDERDVIHVAPNGDDAAAGTRSAPLRTLAGAQARVRSLKAAPGGLPAGGLTVLFAPGTYRMSEAVRFDERDSGSAACPIVYRAEARTTAKMSGSVALDWQRPAADDPRLALVREPYRSRVVTATVPGEGELPGFECGRTQQNPFGYALFREGVRLPLSRWPNGRDALIPAEVVNLDNTGVKKLPAYAFGTDAPRLADWTKEPDPWAWGCWKFGWDDSSMPIQKVDPAAKTLTIGSRYIHYGIAKGSDDGGWYRVLNCLSELDEPGEWVADRKARRLYLLPPAVGAADVVASAADRLVVCTNLAHVAFEGFTFEECRGDAIRMDECTNVAVQASVVRSTGGWAVTILGGRECRVEGCDLYELGEGGVMMVGGDLETLTPCNHLTRNCHIHHFGRVMFNYRSGVKLGDSREKPSVGCRAEHNLIHHTRHAGVTFLGNDHYIGWNVIHDTCIDNYDCGGIYTHTKSAWWERGTVIEYNVVHMTGKRRCSACTEAYYVDGWSSGVTVRHNIASRATRGLFQNGGNDNVYACNLCLGCVKGIQVNNLGLVGNKRPCGPGYPYVEKGRKSVLYSGLVKMKNTGIFDKPAWRDRYPLMLKVLDFPDPVYAHNSLYTVSTNNVWAWCGVEDYQDAEFMKEYKTIAGNVMLDDPGFVDYEGFNWELKPDSPARQVLGGGTRFAEMGLVDDALRVSKAVKFGEGVAPVERRHDYPAPMVSVRAEFDGAPAACGDYVTNCAHCVVSRRWFPKGNIVSAAFGAPMLRSGWQEYSFSFMPLQDETFTLSLEGWRGEKTVYDDVRVTGVTLQNGDFEGAGGWDDVKVNPEMAQYGMITPPYGIQEAAKLEGVTAVKGRNVAVANAYLTVRQCGLKAQKGVPVTVTFKARPYVPGL